MRSRLLFATVVCCLGFLVSQHGARADDHQFRYKAPDAKSVELMCECNGWKSVPMVKGDDGVWTAKVPLTTGIFGYKFLVNGTDWMLDPDNSNKKSVDGIDNSAVESK